MVSVRVLKLLLCFDSSSEFCKLPPSHASRSVGPPRQKSRPPLVGVCSIAIDSSFFFAIWHLHEPRCSNRSSRVQNTSLVSERENKPPRAGAAASSRGGPTETEGREGGRLQNSLLESKHSCKTHRQNRSASFPTGAAGGDKTRRFTCANASWFEGGETASPWQACFGGGRSSNIFNSLRARGWRSKRSVLDTAMSKRKRRHFH